MHIFRTKKYFIAAIFSALLIVGALWFFASDALAQNVNTGLDFAAQTGLSSQDPRVTIAKIIRIILGFLGIVAVGLIIYAGFIWMTAKGEEEKIGQAKKIMLGAVIGLVIVLASFGIATFVLNKLGSATGGSGGTGGGGGGVGGGGNDVFAISATAPANQSVNVPRNAVIRFRFNREVRSNSITGASFVVSVSGSRDVNGNYVEFVPEANCEEPNQTLKCFPKNTVITVAAQSGVNGIMSNDGKELACSNGLCSIQFTVGEIVDTEAPRVNITSQQICVDANSTVRASSIDNYGVSKIDFFAKDNPIGSAINNSNPYIGSPFNAEIPWDTSALTVGETISLKATAYDLDSNNTSATKDAKIVPAHCCNAVKDEDETGVDCGGSCVSCEAMARPVITSVGPAGGFCSNDPNKFCRKSSEVQDCGTNANCDMGTPNGANGNFVTIVGSGFGTSRGKVFFTSATGKRVQAVLADDGSLGNPVCTNSVWQDKQIIAVVPASAANGNISIETANNKSDATDDEYGPLINNFKKNTIERPGICALTPAKGKLNDVVEYQGVKLASAEAYYGSLSNNVKAPISSFTSEKQGTATVPNVVSGSTTTFVLKANVDSNYIPFTKENEPYDGPVISSVEPLSGPVGQYVTIRGSGFGGARGTSKVSFGTNNGIEADYAFPDVCSESIWSDKQIVVKVPESIPANTNYQITLERAGYAAANSGNQTFAVTTGTPNPGICRIQPSLGQANSEVVLWGEYFRAKDANSTIRFYNNKSQQGNAITFWDIDQSASGIKPWKVITTVPQSASTGPVQVIVGLPTQISNALNFTVGTCKQDSDCGSTAVCCSAGLPEAGKCKASAPECYGSVATSVYEWRFSTGNTASCAPDQEQCGTVCCAIGSCENPAVGQCKGCLAGQNKCESGECCNLPCEPGINGGPSYCGDPASCSGYSYNQCLEGFYCPNSPGLCSPYPGTGNPLVVGRCGDISCKAIPGCDNGACTYDAQLNLCVKRNSDSCRRLEMLDNENKVIKVNNQPVAGQCEIYNNNPRWHLSNFAQTCPAGWTRLANNKCVDAGAINGNCTKCSSPLSCQMNGSNGKCAFNQPICPSGSTCDTATSECKKPDQGKCDCCCDKNNTNRDCCAGLTCGGSCGSGQSNLGLCSGCAPGGVPNDDLCNCVGTTGKFCQVTPEFPSGACVDCSSITDSAECSSHSECCVDGKNNNRCTSVVSGGSRFEQNNLQYCAYYNCTNAYPNSCNVNPVVNGVYNKLNSCNQGCATAPISCANSFGICDKNSPCPENMRCDLFSCQCKTNNSGPGIPCRDPLTNQCTGSCSAGYQCLLPSAYNGNGAMQNAPESDSSSTETCRCCCKPPKNGEPDTCKQINVGLDCIADQGACTSPSNERGLCCGCTSDGMCGDVATTGCGLTDARCCQTRPSVTTRVPSPGATDVCRNAAVEAVFNQRMDVTSFSNNVRLIGDYGNKQCPSGYSIVASAPRSNTFWGRLAYGAKKLTASIFPVLLTKEALADVSNYCYVPGSPVAYDSGNNQTKVSYRLTKALDSNIRYYLVVMGDPDLSEGGRADQKDYYNANIVNMAKVGMVGGINGRVPDTFNSTEFKNAEIWSFNTGKDICSLDRVSVAPSFQLFQKSGQKGNLEATALDHSNRAIESIPGLYAWDWSWSSDDTQIATVDKAALAQQAVVTAGNKQDAQTFGRAKATIVSDTILTPSTVGSSREGTAQLRVFLCENPWPVYYSDPPFPPGYSWPWKDGASGLEFYYCRDKNGVGTLDDLPALADDPIVKEGGRKICMFGTNAGKVCSSDANCNNLSGSCLPEVLKEFFFFRETEPGIPSLEGSVDQAGKKVTLRWQPTPNATKYKIYYGLNSGQYVFTTEVPGGSGEITKTIDGLVNGINYYFAVTALSSKNQESIYSNELKLKPADTQAPAVPTMQVSSGDGKISLFWNKVPDAVSYIAYIGAQPRNGGEYPVSSVVRVDPPANTPNVIFTSVNGGGLNNGTTYYVSVRSIDQFGNVSDYAPEVAKKPNEPYLIKLGSSKNSVTVSWLPFIGATGYTIYYGVKPNPGPGDSSLDVSQNIFSKTVSGLNAGETYYFRIKASKASGTSEFSNERSVLVAGGIH